MIIQDLFENKTVTNRQDVAEGSLNELSSDLLQRSAQVAKNKSNQAMDPKIHDALGGGYMNPLAKHYDSLSQKFSNKAMKLGQRDAVKKIASPAVMRKIGMAEGAEPTEKVSAVIKRVLGDKLLRGRNISKLIKSPRAKFDRYQMLHIRVYDDFGPDELNPEPFSANEGQPLAKKLKRALIKAGYPVSSDLLIYPEAIMFNVRKPTTTTAEQGVAEAKSPEEFVGQIRKMAAPAATKQTQVGSKFDEVYDRVEVALMSSGVVTDDLEYDIERALKSLKIKPKPSLIDKIVQELHNRGSQALDHYDDPWGDKGVAEAIVGKPKYSEPHQSGRGFYSAADYMVRTKHQLGSHVYTAVTQVDADNDRYYFIYQKGNKEPVFYATDMGRFEVRTDKLGNRISNAIITAHREATDHGLEKYISGDDESEWDQEKNMAEGLNEMDKSQDPPGRDGGHQFPPGPKVSKKVIKAVEKDPAKHLSDLFAKEYSKKKVKEQGVAEGRPDVMRHTGDRGVRVVRRGGKPIGEIGIDAEASPGSGQYYVKLYDGSVDLSGYDTAEEALDDIKSALGLKEETPVPTAMGAATSQATAPAQSQAQSAALATAQQQQQKREMQDEIKNKQAEISQLQKSMVSV